MPAAHQIAPPATPETMSLGGHGSLVDEARAGADLALKNATRRTKRPVDLFALVGYAIMAGYVAAMVIALRPLS